MNFLNINFDNVCSYLGCNFRNIDSRTLEDISEAVTAINKECNYKFIYKIFDIEKNYNKIDFVGTSFSLQSNGIKNLLKDSYKSILIASTLGQQVDTLIRKIQILDMSKAVVYNAVASSMIEVLTDLSQDEIKKSLENQFFTDRYSPGYGDLSIDIQYELCNILQTGKLIGLNVSSSGIMIPTKSITGIVGISKNPQKMTIRGCNFCNLKNDCEYRKVGKHCG